MQNCIRTENITKVYNPGMPDKVEALSGISATIKLGDVAVLKGPSGSGKTSLLSIIGCMARPTSGIVSVKGQDVAKLPERFLTETRRKTFGFIFQQYNLIRDITVFENITLPMYPLNIGASAMRQRAINVMERLQIRDKQDKRVNQLSGGEQQRVVIARSLINEPDIIIADEPTAHLDQKLSAELIAILAELNQEGRTIIIATHDPFVYDHPIVNQAIAMRNGLIEKDVSL